MKAFSYGIKSLQLRLQLHKTVDISKYNYS